MLNIDMLQGHVTATFSSDKIAVRKWEIACGKEKSLTLAGIKPTVPGFDLVRPSVHTVMIRFDKIERNK